MQMKITFPGGKKVDAQFDGFTVHTDQRPSSGGEGTAPEPFSYFLASIGTCAGIYVLGFCQARGIPTHGIQLTQDVEWDPIKHRLARIHIQIQVPPEFPVKYLDSLRHAAETCAVKRAVMDPPEFVVTTQTTAAQQVQPSA